MCGWASVSSTSHHLRHAQVRSCTYPPILQCRLIKMAASIRLLCISVLVVCSQLVPCWGRHPLPLSLIPLNSTQRGMRRLQQATASEYQLFYTDNPTACTASSVTLGTRTIKMPTNLVAKTPSQSLLWSGLGDCSNLVLSIAANFVPGSSAVIAGTVDVDHKFAVLGQGYITAIPSGGSLQVSAAGQLITVALNDPKKVYSDGTGSTGADTRFATDPDDAMVAASTGFPMCIPLTGSATCPPGQNRFPATQTTAPAIGTAATQRTGTMDPLYPAFVNNWRGQNPYQYIVSKFSLNAFNPAKKAAFQIGDYVSFAGYWDTVKAQVIAYSITADQLSLFTEPGYEPAFASFEAAVAGTSSQKLAVAVAEQATRTRYEGQTTDPWRPIRITAFDYAPAGVVTYREYGLVMPDYGPALKGVQPGRWRFRPPCGNGLPDTGNAGCTAPSTVLPPTKGGVTVNPYYPAPAEVAAVPSQSPATGTQLINTWYQTRTIEYLYGEGLPGSPPTYNAFFDLLYLHGGYAGATGTLTPFPSASPNTDNGVVGFPTLTAPKPFTNLRAAANWCLNTLFVCAWATIPSAITTTQFDVFMLPYFAGPTPSQWPPNYDFTLTANTVDLSLTSTKAGLWCGTFSNAPEPVLPLGFVIRPTAAPPAEPVIVGDSYMLPVNKITQKCPTPTSLTDPKGRYGFAAPYIL